MNKNDWEKIKDGISNGVYKLIRLVKIENGKATSIVAYNRSTTGKEAMQRFEYIRIKSTSLEAGEYEVQCKVGANSNSMMDSFKLSVKERKMITIPVKENGDVIDKTKEQITMESISLEEHIDLIRENATLKANIQVLEKDVEFYKKEMLQLQTQLTNRGMSDGEAMAKPNPLAQVLEETAPALIGTLGKYLDILDKRENNKQAQLSNGKVKKIGMSKSRKTLEDIANDYADLLEPLMDSDPEKFDAELDILEKEQPDVYDMVVQLLDLEEGEEGDENAE